MASLRNPPTIHPTRDRCPAPRRVTLWLLVLLAPLAGCVTRRFTVYSNPPGARVIVDDLYDVGVTPTAFNYTYYGTRKITLIKDGYETLTVRQQMPTPWYEYFPLEFFSENVIPYEIRDERAATFTLQPQRIVPRDELRQRAEDLRATYGVRPAAAPPAAPAIPALPAYQPPAPTVNRLPPFSPQP